MSRSALAERFAQLGGEAPMRYLANWRMQLAKQLLREGTHSIQAVATRVGYESKGRVQPGVQTRHRFASCRVAQGRGALSA
jgi:AraC-like DNA-binding protein